MVHCGIRDREVSELLLLNVHGGEKAYYGGDGEKPGKQYLYIATRRGVLQMRAFAFAGCANLVSPNTPWHSLC